MAKKIIGIGESVFDVIFRNGQPQSATPGGSTFNAMISLGRVVPLTHPDVPVMIITEFGDDNVGEIITAYMKENGVSADYVHQGRNMQSMLAMAFLDSNNNAQYEFYKDPHSDALTEEMALQTEIGPDDLILIGSHFAINPKIRPFTKALMEKANKLGATIYYDINFRKSYVPQIEELIGNIKENCRLAGIVRGSDEDFGYLLGTTDPDTIYKEFMADLCPNFICTCGDKPVQFFSPSGKQTFAVPTVKTVSTIGAGDNFNAGIIYGLMLCGKKPGELQADEIPAIINRACRFSANVCESISNNISREFASAIAAEAQKK